MRNVVPPGRPSWALMSPSLLVGKTTVGCGAGGGVAVGRGVGIGVGVSVGRMGAVAGEKLTAAPVKYKALSADSSLLAA